MAIFLPNYSHDYVRSYTTRAEDIDLAQANRLFDEMEKEGAAALAAAGVPPERISFVRSVDMRYVGQFHEVDVVAPATDLDAASMANLVAAFHARHNERYSFSVPNRHVEMLYFRVRVLGATPKIQLKEVSRINGAAPAVKSTSRAYFGKSLGWVDISIYDGASLKAGAKLSGPAIIEEPTTTILVPHGFSCEVDRFGNLMLAS